MSPDENYCSNKRATNGPLLGPSLREPYAQEVSNGVYVALSTREAAAACSSWGILLHQMNQPERHQRRLVGMFSTYDRGIVYSVRRGLVCPVRNGMTTLVSESVFVGPSECHASCNGGAYSNSHKILSHISGTNIYMLRERGARHEGKLWVGSKNEGFGPYVFRLGWHEWNGQCWGAQMTNLRAFASPGFATISPSQIFPRPK